MSQVYQAGLLPPIPPPEYRLVRCVRELERISKLDFNEAAVVDIGCNLGQLCYHIKRCYPACSVHGVDDYITTEHDPHFHYQGHDLAQSLPYPDATMDAAFALEVLEHMVDTDFFLNECQRILKPGGWLIITTPNICGLRNRIRVPLGLYPHSMEYRTVIHHVRLYNRETLMSHLQERGFTNVTVTGTHMLPLRWLEVSPAAQRLSDWLSGLFSTLSSGLLAQARKP